MIGTYMQSLLAMSKDKQIRLGFYGEAQLGRISDEQKYDLAVKSRKYGRSIAEKVRKACPFMGPEEMLEVYGLRLEECREEIDADYPLFASFFPPDLIRINADNIEKSCELINENHLESLLENVDLRQLLIAHEFYHFLETKEVDPFPQRKVEMNGVFFGKVHRHVDCLEEMAAMAFAETLCGISYTSFFLNVLMLEPMHPQKADALFHSYMDFRG